MSSRIEKTFSNNKKKLVTYVMGGDPDLETSKEIIRNISKSGADIIEIGMPFSDPMADGPTIQKSATRVINNKVNLDDIFSISKHLRTENEHIPIILMGYYNVIFHYGVNKFVKSCVENGIDGLIIVDLQPEEDTELLSVINSADLDLIRLITPTTNENRLKTILEHSSGFLYYVTITGITGQHSADLDELQTSINQIRKHTSLPIVAGFGIKDENNVKEICRFCDGAVVGSSIVKIIENNIDNKKTTVSLISEFVKKLKEGTF